MPLRGNKQHPVITILQQVNFHDSYNVFTKICAYIFLGLFPYYIIHVCNDNHMQYVQLLAVTNEHKELEWSRKILPSLLLTTDGEVFLDSVNSVLIYTHGIEHSFGSDAGLFQNLFQVSRVRCLLYIAVLHLECVYCSCYLEGGIYHLHLLLLPLWKFWIFWGLYKSHAMPGAQ